MANVLGGSGVFTGPTPAENLHQAAASRIASSSARSQSTASAVAAMQQAAQLRQQKARDAEAKRAQLWKELMELASEAVPQGTSPLAAFNDPDFQRFAYNHVGKSPALAGASQQEKEGFFRTLFGSKETPLKDRAKAAMHGLFGGSSGGNADLAALGNVYTGQAGEEHIRDRVMSRADWAPGQQEVTPNTAQYDALLASLKQPVAAQGAPSAPAQSAAPTQSAPTPVQPAPAAPSAPVVPAAGNFSMVDGQGRYMGEQVHPNEGGVVERPNPPDESPEMERAKLVEAEHQRLLRAHGTQNTLSVPKIREYRAQAEATVDAQLGGVAPVDNAGVDAQGDGLADKRAFVKWMYDNPGAVTGTIRTDPTGWSDELVERVANDNMGGNYDKYRTSGGRQITTGVASQASSAIAAPGGATSAADAQGVEIGKALGWNEREVALARGYVNGEYAEGSQEYRDGRRLMEAAKTKLVTETRRTVKSPTWENAKESPETVERVRKFMEWTDPEASPVLNDPRFSHIFENVAQLSIDGKKAQTEQALASAGLDRKKAELYAKELEAASASALAEVMMSQNEAVKNYVSLISPVAETLLKAQLADVEAAKDEKAREAAIGRLQQAINENPHLKGLTEMATALATQTGLAQPEFLYQILTINKGGLFGIGKETVKSGAVAPGVYGTGGGVQQDAIDDAMLKSLLRGQQ